MDNPPFLQKSAIWFHACSFGEVNALEPIIEQIKKPVSLSVITNTGFQRASLIKNAEVRYLPFEIFLPFWINKPKVLIVLEAELWPMLFLTCKQRGAKTILLNARISDRSYGAYKRFAWLYRWIFSHIDLVFAQSETDKKRLQFIGAKKVIVNGNIKTMQTPVLTCKLEKPNKEVITLASTHEGEEEFLLNVLQLKKEQMLIVVPRHPERFAKVDMLLRQYAQKHGLLYEKWSSNKSLSGDIILCDAMGELINIYAITDITYLGGSFIPSVGGHNPLEPAFFHNKIISGAFFYNQKPLYALVKNIYITTNDALKNIDYKTVQKSEVLHKGNIKVFLKELP